MSIFSFVFITKFLECTFEISVCIGNRDCLITENETVLKIRFVSFLKYK